MSPATQSVFNALKRNPKNGLTDEEIAARTGLIYETASRKRRALVDAGRVVDSGRSRSFESGRTGAVWMVA